VILVGPRAVGTSTLGYSLARSAWEQGVSTGFLDLDQLSFLRSPGAATHLHAGLGVTNTVALHRPFASRGAGRLIVSSHLTDETDQEHLRSAADVPVTIVRLRADEATLAGHVRTRSRGSQARLAGDDLINADLGYQERVVREAVARQQVLDQGAGEDLLLDVTDRTADSVVAEIRELLLRT
jgi:hypothetical protein